MPLPLTIIGYYYKMITDETAMEETPAEGTTEDTTNATAPPASTPAIIIHKKPTNEQTAPCWQFIKLLPDGPQDPTIDPRHTHKCIICDITLLSTWKPHPKKPGVGGYLTTQANHHVVEKHPDTKEIDTKIKATAKKLKEKTDRVQSVLYAAHFGNDSTKSNDIEDKKKNL